MKKLTHVAKRFLKKNGSLESNNSKVLKIWDYKKNKISPKFITEISREYYWFICTKRSHSFKTSPYRAKLLFEKTQGCSKCYDLDRSQIVRSYYIKNNLTLDKGDKFLAKQFDEKKNKIKVSQINCQSGLKAWWICPNGHSYQCVVNKRYLRGDGCTTCGKNGISRIQLIIEHELKTIFKNLINDKRLEKKYRLDFFIPEINLVIEYDGKKFHNHEKDLIKNKAIKKAKLKLIRIREIPLKKTTKKDILYKSTSNKPSNLKKLIDELLTNIKKFKLPTKFTNKIDKYISQNNFQNELGWRKVLAEFPKPPLEKRLTYLSPKLSKEWDFKKNYPLKPDNYMATSRFMPWWRCSKCNYSWKAMIYQRYARGDGCLSCYGQIRAETIRLAKLKNQGSIIETHPEIAKEWNYKKNKRKPEEFSFGSTYKAWWNCTKKHESYLMIINKRTREKQGCGICGYIKSGRTSNKTIIRKIGSIVKTHPKIIKFWDYKKNKTKPNEYTYGSHFQAWWICLKGHKGFKKSIKQRIRDKSDCRICSYKVRGETIKKTLAAKKKSVH